MANNIERVTMHHPETGGEITVAKSARRTLVQAGWVEGENPNKPKEDEEQVMAPDSTSLPKKGAK